MSTAAKEEDEGAAAADPFVSTAVKEEDARDAAADPYVSTAAEEADAKALDRSCGYYGVEWQCGMTMAMLHD